MHSLILQQPRSHIPLYEADYQKVKEKAKTRKVKQVKQVRVSRLADSMHRFKLSAHPQTDISRREQNKIVSVSPFDARFPVFAAKPKEIVPLYTVSPFDTAFPVYKKKIIEESRVTLDSDVAPVAAYSPWDEDFPRFTQKHRLSRNKSAIKKRKLRQAMLQYRRERGPASQRPIYTPKPAAILEGSVVSYSPWDSLAFCMACDLPLEKLLKNGKQIAAQLAKAKRPVEKKWRFKSYSPFDAKYPLGVEEVIIKPTVKAANAFPAFSPLAKKGQQAPVDFKLPAATSTPAVAKASSANARKVLPMH